MGILQKIRNLKSIQFSFGTTSAIITNIALIIGLDSATNAKLPIIGSIIVLALADNISDTLGIHMYQESEGLNPRQIWTLTSTNFISRFLTAMGFVVIMLLFPLTLAVVLSLIYGLTVLSVVSYIIAVNRKMDARHAILEHLVFAVIIIIISRLIGMTVVNAFK